MWDITKIIVVDMYSGSHTEKYEEFNLKKNIENDNKYYAYIPPYDSVNLKSLGFGKSEQGLDVLVVFVRKVSNGLDRKIVAYYPHAKVFSKRKKLLDKTRSLQNKDNDAKNVSYTVESDTCIEIFSDQETFVIETSKINNYMFRKQRVYGNKYKNDDWFLRMVNFLENHYSKYEKSDWVKIQNSKILNIDEQQKLLMSKPKFTSNKIICPSRNFDLVKTVLEKNNYECFIDNGHKTFQNKKGINYMEGHHVIPFTLENVNYFWNNFQRNLDCTENIIPLCPLCHRAIHFANDNVKKDLIKKIYDKQIQKLNDANIQVTENELMKFYKL